MADAIRGMGEGGKGGGRVSVGRYIRLKRARARLLVSILVFPRYTENFIS